VATFTLAEKDVAAVFDQARESWHTWTLGDSNRGIPKLTLTIQMAEPARDEGGNAKSPALSDDGWPVAGKVKITNHHDRVAGLNDVIIDIDADAWEDMSEQTQLALADNLLSRIEPKIKDGLAVLDDCGRPKLLKRKPDARIGDVYYEVVKRHGAAATEVKALAKVWDDTKEWVQTSFNYGTWG
jgi:hypothetical protein